ncbi:MAG: hypothetical protein C0621_08455 [Desulfuromonas sp.]|nr:MAG: hypothetical protein C0621_08455 [Desulfuromonas sp.]
MVNTEELREMLVDLNRARDSERRHRIVLEGVLEGLRIITQAENTFEAFNSLLKVFKDFLGFDHAFVLQEKNPGVFSVSAATDDVFAATLWVPGKVFERVLSGQIIVMFDVQQSVEWNVQSERMKAFAASALHAPLNTPTSKAILVCVSSQKSFFNVDHKNLMVRFAPLACQALNNLENSQKLVSESKKLKEAQKSLEQLDRLKSEFISTAAHELRTPVASIMGYTELISDKFLSESFSDEQKDDFGLEIINNADRLTKLIDDILDVSRIESGQSIPLDFDHVIFKELVHRIVERFNFQSKNLIDIDVDPNLPETISIDSHRISQVIENLLSNSIKYSPEGSRVSIFIEKDESFCKTSVVDCGKGMNREQVEKVFDKFYRADMGNTAVRGLGLGMSIVKQIIVDHKGIIRVDSAVGKGTTVSFWLPL